MTIIKNRFFGPVIILIVSLFIFTRGLAIHGLEYRDDEIFYYQSTQEMVETKNYLSPTYFGEDRFQKPILYYWFILFSYKLMGVNWFSARFVASVFGAFSLILSWLLAKELFNKRIAHLSVVILMTTPLFFRHAKEVVPDMPMNFFIVLSMYCVWTFLNKSSDLKFRILFFVSCALGFLIKGFAAFIPIVCALVFTLGLKQKGSLKEWKFGQGMMLMLLIIAPWFLYMIYTHGQQYLDYMLIEETQNRLSHQDHGFDIFFRIRDFFNKILYYSNVIFSYFAPWSIFIFVAIPYTLSVYKKRTNEQRSFQFVLIWFFSVFLFFSLLHVRINHYMLVLTTPFAILVSYFLLDPLEGQHVLLQILTGFRKYMLIFTFTVGVVAYSFLIIFLVGANRMWLLLIGAIFVAGILSMLRLRKPFIAPACLGVLLLGVYSQSAILNQAGVTEQAPLQRIAQIIEQNQDSYLVGVGSHDIHEKKLQVFFDQQVIKSAASSVEETKGKLNQLMSSSEGVYCLMIEEDYLAYKREVLDKYEHDIFYEDYIFRKRLNIDKGFFKALVTLDQETVYDYFMEKIILLKKDSLV